MFRGKKNITEEPRPTKIMREPTVEKMLYSDIPLGSVMFVKYSDGRKGTHIYEKMVYKKLNDFETREHKVCEHLGCGEYDRYTVYLTMFVKNEDMYEHGFMHCVINNIYTIIDVNYVEKVKKIRELKTISDIKKYLESSL